VNRPLSVVVIPATLFLLHYKGNYKEVFIGFFLILVIADTRYRPLKFAVDVKNVYLVVLAFLVLFDRRNFTSLVKLYQRFLPFFVVATIALVFSKVPFIAMQKTLSYLLLLIVVPTFVVKLYEEYGNRVFRYIIHFYIVLFILGLVLRLVFPDFVLIGGRYSGVLGNPNGLGIFTFFGIIVASVILEKLPGLCGRWELILFYGLAFISLLLCGSRGAIIGTLIFLSFAYFFRMSPFLGLIVLVLVIVGYELLLNNVSVIIIALGLEDYFRIETLEIGSGRLVAWKFAWEHIQSSFFLGKGFANTEQLFATHHRELNLLGHQGNAHNSYLTFWLDTGIIGLLLFLRALVSVFTQASKTTRLAFPILFAVLFYANIESWLTASLNPFTIQLMIVLTVLLFVDFKDSEEDDTPTTTKPGTPSNVITA
ncbi:MAG: O-antigen ligase family protein, partial [Bacteroidota bacterium]